MSPQNTESFGLLSLCATMNFLYLLDFDYIFDELDLARIEHGQRQRASRDIDVRAYLLYGAASVQFEIPFDAFGDRIHDFGGQRLLHVQEMLNELEVS